MYKSIDPYPFNTLEYASSEMNIQFQRLFKFHEMFTFSICFRLFMMPVLLKVCLLAEDLSKKWFFSARELKNLRFFFWFDALKIKKRILFQKKALWWAPFRSKSFN